MSNNTSKPKPRPRPIPVNEEHFYYIWNVLFEKAKSRCRCSIPGSFFSATLTPTYYDEKKLPEEFHHIIDNSTVLELWHSIQVPCWSQDARMENGQETICLAAIRHIEARKGKLRQVIRHFIDVHPIGLCQHKLTLAEWKRRHLANDLG